MSSFWLNLIKDRSTGPVAVVYSTLIIDLAMKTIHVAPRAVDLGVKVHKFKVTYEKISELSTNTYCPHSAWEIE